MPGANWSSCWVLQAKAGRQHQLRAEYYAINQHLYSYRGTQSPVPAMQTHLTFPEESLFTQALCLLPGGCGEGPCIAGRGQWTLPHLTCLMASSGSFMDTFCCCHELFLPLNTYRADRPDAEGRGGGDLCLESPLLSPSWMAKMSGVCGHCYDNCSNNWMFW